MLTAQARQRNYGPENRAISVGEDAEDVGSVLCEQGQVPYEGDGWWAGYPSNPPVWTIEIAQYSHHQAQQAEHSRHHGCPHEGHS